MNHMKEHPKFSKRYQRFYASILFPYICYKLKLYPEGKMKENLMKKYLNALSGFTEAEIRAFCDETDVYMKDSFHRSEEHTSELQSRFEIVCRRLPDKKTHMQVI